MTTLTPTRSDTACPVPRSMSAAAEQPAPPMLEIVVPVFNEAADLAPSIERLHGHLTSRFPFSARVTIADNASSDGTASIADDLASRLPGVCAVHLEEKGRGRAVRQVWASSDAPVLAYMDVDLATDLNALLPLVAPLLSGHSEVAIGSRLARGSRVMRGIKRELISRSYNLLLHATLATRFSDAQCGFKAIRADAALPLLPLVRDDAWFFDTELLVLAERAGLRIHEVPVDWSDDPDSRVEIVRTAVDDIKGVLRLIRGFAAGSIPLDHVSARLGGRSNRDPALSTAAQLLRFAAIGAVSTIAYLSVYIALRTGISAQWANVIALLTTATANIAANRRFTFSVRGRQRAFRHQLQGLLVFAVAWGVTASSLATLRAGAPTSGRMIEVAVLIVANLVATASRFVLLRRWVFRTQTDR